jgi:sirohydrochlorin cobaltochelatase
MTFAANDAPSGELSGALSRDFTGGTASLSPLSQALPGQGLPGQGLPGQGPHGPLGVLICGHGSRNRLAVAEFAALADQLRQRLNPVPLEYGYLEFARPILREGLDSLRQRGVEHVLAVPAMLFAAGHAKNDIPSVLNTYAAETGLRIDYGRELGVDLAMIRAAGARIQAALAATEAPIALHDTLLVVVGRGSSDPDANSNVAKVTRLLVEGLGFGWGETLYSGVTFPLVEPGLRHLVRLGFRRIVVFPYFLFSGVLVSRIVQHSQRVAADHPEVEFVQASYLGDHPQVLQTFVQRVEEVLLGETAMNCGLCKYRDQVLGFEQEVGRAQHSHHHHVEGLVESCTLCERECTGACQSDGVPLTLVGHGQHSHEHHEQPAHHHPPYPHADHPLGPVSLRRGEGVSGAGG